MRKKSKLINDCCESQLTVALLSSVYDSLSCDNTVSDINTINKDINLVMSKDNIINKKNISTNNCIRANRELTLEDQEVMCSMFFCQVKLYRDSCNINNVTIAADDSFLGRQLVRKLKKMKLQVELFGHTFLSTKQRNKIAPLTHEQQDKIFEYYYDSLHFELFKLMRERIHEQFNNNTLEEIEFMQISTAYEAQQHHRNVSLSNVSQVLERCRENIETLDKKIMMLNKVTKLNPILLHQCEQELRTGVLAATMEMQTG